MYYLFYVAKGKKNSSRLGRLQQWNYKVALIGAISTP